MTVRVLLFAVLRDAAGTGRMTLELSAGATAADAAAELLGRFGSLGPLLPRVGFAVNQEYVAGDTELHDLGEIMTRVRDHMRAQPPRSAAARKRRPT